MTDDKNSIFKVVFFSQGQVYEIFARHVSHGSLFGFVEVEEMLFGEKTQVVVDPSEEALKKEFDGVRRTYLPMHSILRIDEVEKEGNARIRSVEGDSSNVRPFPMSFYPPSSKE